MPTSPPILGAPPVLGASPVLLYQYLNITGHCSKIDTDILALAEIKQGVRSVVGCKSPDTGKIGISVESINKGNSAI